MRLTEESDDFVTRIVRGRSRYEQWFDQQQDLLAREIDREDLDGPLISVVMPVCDPDARWLAAAIDSVCAQTYARWELCVVDDASRDASTESLLTRMAADEDRIRVERNPTRLGISRTSNRAVDMARGDYVAFLDHDDEITPQALALVARSARDASFDILYSDEDKIDRKGRLRDPTFKPDKSSELLRACMYFGHLVVYRREFFQSLGGFDPAFDGSQDYDLALRGESSAVRVVHLPVVLYHWRMAVGSAASVDEDAKPWAYEAGRRAIEAHVARHDEDARVEDGVGRGHSRTVRAALPDTRISVLYCACCYEPEAGSGGSRPETVEATSGAVIEWIAMPDHAKSDGGESIGERWNQAAARSSGDVLIFLEGVRPVESSPPNTARWWEELAAQATREGVGAVGAKVRSSRRALLHMGVVLGGPEVVRTRTPGLRSDEAGHLALAQSLREVSALSGGCIAIRRELLGTIGGFDTRYQSALHDVDLCLRLRARGLRLLYDPYVECELVETHHGASKTGRDALPTAPPDDLFELSRAWRDELAMADPFSNPNFHRTGAIFDPCHRVRLS